MMNRTISTAVLMLSVTGCATGGLPKFGADIGMQSVMGNEVRPPYTDTISYFGYIAPGKPPDEVRDGKKMYYLYLWIPAVAPEVGVRMVSPVKGMATPAASDFVAPDYTASADSADYFDTWVRVERCTLAIKPEDIDKPCAGWTNYGENDDSSELPAQPSGSKYNSVLRVATDTSNPLKALVRGMYRIVFTTFKTGEVKGTFLAQVGAPVKLPGVAIAQTPAELKKIVEAAK